MGFALAVKEMTIRPVTQRARGSLDVQTHQLRLRAPKSNVEACQALQSVLPVHRPTA